MSQYRLNGKTPNGTVDVLLGWDEPMNIARRWRELRL